MLPLMRMQVLFIIVLLGLSAHAVEGRHNRPPVSVNGQIFRGGKPYEPRLIQLANDGFRTVINLQGGDLRNFGIQPIVRMVEPGEIAKNILLEKQIVESLGMNFLNVPINSLVGVRPVDEPLLDQALETMHDVNSQPVFVHCEFGRDRTGLLIALYRVKYEGWNSFEAYREWVNNGHRNLARLVTSALDRYFFKKVRQFGAEPCDEALKK